MWHSMFYARLQTGSEPNPSNCLALSPNPNRSTFIKKGSVLDFKICGGRQKFQFRTRTLGSEAP